MAPTLCCMCAKPLQRKDAKWCVHNPDDPHRQYDSDTTPPSPAKGSSKSTKKSTKTAAKVSPYNGGDRDNSDASDSDIAISSAADFIPNSKSKRRTEHIDRRWRALSSATELADSFVAETRPVVDQLKEKSRKRDAEAKRTEKAGGGYGVNPVNSTKVVRHIFIWFVERPPVKAVYCGHPFILGMDIDIFLTTAQDVHNWIMSCIPKAVGFKDHSAIRNGSLIVDKDRLAYIGKAVESGGTQVPAKYEIYDYHKNPQVATISKDFPINSTKLYFMIPMIKADEVNIPDTPIISKPRISTSVSTKSGKNTLSLPKSNSSKRSRSNTIDNERAGTQAPVAFGQTGRFIAIKQEKGAKVVGRAGSKAPVAFGENKEFVIKTEKVAEKVIASVEKDFRFSDEESPAEGEENETEFVDVDDVIDKADLTGDGVQETTGEEPKNILPSLSKSSNKRQTKGSLKGKGTKGKGVEKEVGEEEVGEEELGRGKRLKKVKVPFVSRDK